MSKNVHIIQKQRYEIRTTKQRIAMDIQNMIGEINTHYILPILAEKLDSYFLSDEVVTIDKLELDIGNIKNDASDDEWVKRIFENLDSKLRSRKIIENKNERKQREKHLVESWAFFLKSGLLPGDCIYKGLDEIKKELVTINENGKNLLRNFLFKETNDDIITRLVANAEYEIIKIHLELLFPGVNIDWLNSRIAEAVLEIKDKTSASTTSANFYSHLLWHHIIRYFIFNKDKINSKEEIIQQLATKTTKLKEIDRSNLPELEEKDSIEKQVHDLEKLTDEINDSSKESLFISNAGICLLAPWLPSFFKEAGLLRENNFIDKWKQQHAVYLLHYLVTYEEDPTEELLIFSKLLCGWPLQMPVVNSYEITEREKSECYDLLRSVIENWKALKNTSIEGLQGSFLQRSGKLIEQENQFVLQPEQQSIDLLLEYVPWTFRYTRLPWMKKAVEIEWY
jgi:hypothetical protein